MFVVKEKLFKSMEPARVAQHFLSFSRMVNVEMAATSLKDSLFLEMVIAETVAHSLSPSTTL